jgi:hypothetical protein
MQESESVVPLRARMCSYSRKVLTLTHENESGTNHPNVNESGTSRHIQNTECNKSYNPLFSNDSFLFTSSSICQRFNSSKDGTDQPPQGINGHWLRVAGQNTL